MGFTTEAEEGVLAGGEATPDQRLAAVWSKAHDLAAERYGDDAVMAYFTGEAGRKLIDELSALPEDAAVADMLAVVEKHVPDKKPKPKPAPEPAKT